MADLKVRVVAGVAGLAALGGVVAVAADDEGRKRDRTAAATPAPAPPQPPTRRPRYSLDATFGREPNTLDELVARADAAVEVTVVRIDTRTENPSAEPPHPDGSGLVDKQRITFEVAGVVYGEPPREFTIEKLGSQEVAAEGDPPYRVGERYLLFVERLEDAGLYARTSLTGRLRVKGDGKVDTFVDFELAQKLRGRDAAELKQTIKDKAKEKGK